MTRTPCRGLHSLPFPLRGEGSGGRHGRSDHAQTRRQTPSHPLHHFFRLLQRDRRRVGGRVGAAKYMLKKDLRPSFFSGIKTSPTHRRTANRESRIAAERWRSKAVVFSKFPVGRLSLSLSLSCRSTIPTPQGDRYDRTSRPAVVPFFGHHQPHHRILISIHTLR